MASDTELHAAHLAASTLTALAEAGLVLATVDAQRRLLWCTPAFAALFAPPAAAGQALQQLLGDAADARLAGGEAVDCALAGADGTPQHWRLQLRGNGAMRALGAEPLAALLQSQAANDDLRARLDLVQTFTRTGVFERDPATLQGHWDAHMYRIWGLTEQPPGAASPPYADLAAMIVSEDRLQNAFVNSLLRSGDHAQRVRIRRADGELRYLNTQWRVLHDAQGKPRQVLGVNTDDTEVYELANRAQRLRAELDVALELGHIAVWRHDLASDRVFLDRRGSEIVGIEHDEQGVSLAAARARIHADDLPLAASSVALTLRTGAPSDMELRYPRQGGGWKHVLMRRALHQAQDGSLLGFIGVMLDVTERVAEGRHALELARRLEAAAETARIGLWSTRTDGPLPDWSPRVYTLLGLDPARGPLAFHDWITRCVHPDDAARTRQGLLARWRAGSGSIEIEFRVLRPSDGALRWLVMRGEIRRSDADGAARRAEGVVIDVTEQQQTLRQLRDTVERMTLTNRALGLGTWEGDSSTGRVLWDAQMFHLRGVESAGRPLDRSEVAGYVHPEDRSAVMLTQTNGMLDGDTWHTEFRVQHPDGQVRWLTSQSVPVLDEQGEERRRIGINWDSTEARQVGEGLRLRERALAEGRAKSQTLSRISHELRTPLNAVLGFVQLLRGSQAQTDGAQRQRWLAHIDGAGRHLLALIDDVLELSRAEAGGNAQPPQVVALATVVEATLPLLAAEAAARQVDLQCGGLDGLVRADPVRLRQVLINLLSNAIKYNRPGGSVRLWSTQRGLQNTLHVADTGQGIAPDQLQQAFEPFNRLGAEASGVEGSGIGLAIVKVLVEHMGGSVEVRSQPGQGSEFIVTLPAAQTGALPPPAPAATPAGAAAPTTLPPAPASEPPARLLYIEDNPVNALLLRELLADRPGVELQVADTGHAGVLRARDWQPALILVDMQLPDIDGHAVLRALRADPATAAIRCVVLSANATPDDRQAALAAGFVQYWTKPIEFDRFLHDLSVLLGRAL